MPSTGPSQSGLVAIGIATALTVISTCFVILRFWARSITKFGLWLDDWLALATLVTLYATLVISIVVVVYAGVGKPILQALEEDPYVITKVLKLLYTFEFVYLFSSPLMKLTVLAYYWRMFPRKGMRLGIKILSAMCILWFITMVITNLLECQPISRFWNITGPGFCRFPAAMYYVGVAVPNTVIDIFTVLLPIYEVWHLKLSYWKRLGVCAVFGIGGIVVIASIVRLVLLILSAVKGTENLTEDLLWPWFSTTIEVATAIVGSCLPCLVPLYRRIRYGTANSRTAYGLDSSQKSRGLALSNAKGMSGGRSVRQALSSTDAGGPFERIKTATASQDDAFGPVSPEIYVAKATGTTPARYDHKSADDEIPLQGINVMHEVTVKHTSATWLDLDKA